MNDETSQLIQAVTDEFYGLHCDIGRLEQENARLRDLMYDRAHVYAIQHMTEDELCITATNALEENRKLRELVCHLYEYRQLYFKTGIYPTDHGVTEQRMRELGVEVDVTDEQEEAEDKPSMRQDW